MISSTAKTLETGKARLSALSRTLYCLYSFYDPQSFHRSYIHIYDTHPSLPRENVSIYLTNILLYAAIPACVRDRASRSNKPHFLFLLRSSSAQTFSCLSWRIFKQHHNPAVFAPQRQPSFCLAQSNTQYLCANAEGQVVWEVFWKSLETRVEIWFLLLLEIWTFSITLTDFTAIYFAAIIKGGNEPRSFFRKLSASAANNFQTRVPWRTQWFKENCLTSSSRKTSQCHRC